MKLRGRVERLERPPQGGRLPAWARALAERVAIEHGLDPAEVVREAEVLLPRVAAAGVLGSAEQLAALLAAEDGLDPAAVLAEVDRLTGTVG